MKRLVLAAVLALTTLPLAGLPAAAGSFGFDLPRLDFPVPANDGLTTRDGQTPVTPVVEPSR